MGLTVAVSVLGDGDAPAVHVVIANDDSAPVKLCTATFAPALALEVTDAAGERVPLGPPPTPPADLSAYTVTIEGGGTLDFMWSGTEVFPNGLAPGSYRLRFVTQVPPVEGGWSGELSSAPTEFTVG
jgi:hypothetical protein